MPRISSGCWPRCASSALLWAVLVVCPTMSLIGASSVSDMVPGTQASSTAGPGSLESANSSTIPALKDRQANLAERRKAVEQVLENYQVSPSRSVDVENLRMELEVLKYFELVCAQHAEELGRTAGLQQDLKLSEERLHGLRLAGPEEQKPYSILLLDDVSDRLEAKQSRLRSVSIELAASKEMQLKTDKMYQESEAKRRQAKEKLATASDESVRTKVAKQLELSRLQSDLYAELGRLRHTEIVNYALEQKALQNSLDYLQEKQNTIASEAIFTQEHLQTILSELQKFESELQAQLPQLQLRLQELESQILGAGQQGDTSRGNEQLQDEMKNGWQVARRSYQRQVKMVQQRLRDLVIARLQWDVRYRVFNNMATRQEVAEWRQDAELFLERVRAGRETLEDESKGLLVELGQNEKRLRIARQSAPEVARWIEYQIDQMHELSQAYATNLVQIEMVERMLAKLNAMLTTDLEPDSARDLLGAVVANLKASWNYELTSVDDRPITVRKVISGLVLMLLGLSFSRRISRLLGRRMLPRLGLNNGAATAIQSIAFYVLITCFAFISLELVNVPITVFAFLGGAVAIGVGFGSQNILNNFISGLILLAEQPIRVGDLVDLGGLSGNVEKIGARSTRVKTGANLEIIVPNSKFLEDNVTNWTLSDTRMRTVVKIGVAYGSPTGKVAQVLQQAISECPLAMTDPEPIVLFSDFGDNALNFEVHFWTHVRTMMQARKVESDVRHVIDRLMAAADITIAFPQRDIHLDAVKPIEVQVRQFAEEHGYAVRRSNAA